MVMTHPKPRRVIQIRVDARTKGQWPNTFALYRECVRIGSGGKRASARACLAAALANFYDLCKRRLRAAGVDWREVLTRSGLNPEADSAPFTGVPERPDQVSEY